MVWGQWAPIPRMVPWTGDRGYSPASRKNGPVLPDAWHCDKRYAERHARDAAGLELRFAVCALPDAAGMRTKLLIPCGASGKRFHLEALTDDVISIGWPGDVVDAPMPH